MAESTLADHQCTVVEYCTAVRIWRCACGRAYRLITGEGHVRAPEMDFLGLGGASATSSPTNAQPQEQEAPDGTDGG